MYRYRNSLMTSSKIKRQETRNVTSLQINIILPMATSSSEECRIFNIFLRAYSICFLRSSKVWSDQILHDIISLGSSFWNEICQIFVSLILSMLKVEVTGATNLPDVDKFSGKSDPYAVVRFQGENIGFCIRMKMSSCI